MIGGTIVVVGEDVALVGASPAHLGCSDRPAARPETDPSLIEPPPGIDPAAAVIIEVVRRARSDSVDPRYISRPEPIVFPTWYEEGTVTGPLVEESQPRRGGGRGRRGRRPREEAAPPPGLEAHALYFPPTNEDFEPPPDEKPPLLVISHGGPTSAHETT